jgi:hydroxymethylbilane synthase
MSSSIRIRLGTRGSALARWQANWVAGQLNRLGVHVELVEIFTSGDRQQTPIGASTAPGLFTKEIQRALLDGQIDLAVHSLKDLPTDKVSGLTLAAVPPRAPVADALICPNHDSLDALPQGSTIGTGSLRRRAQLLHARADLQMKDIRGNVDTRLRKLDEGQYDAIILAEAGLRRLELADRIAQLLPVETVLPAIGQGALGLEPRVDDRAVRAALLPLNDEATHASVRAERMMLAELLGGCLAPIGAWGRVEDGTLVLTGRVIRLDGSESVEATASGTLEEAVQVGTRGADALVAQGADDFIRCSRNGS